jgi:glycerol-1-phosphate dehydrogenase [NAD(P)+]
MLLDLGIYNNLNTEVNIGENYFNEFYDIIAKLNLGQNYKIITDENIKEILPTNIQTDPNLITLTKTVKAKLETAENLSKKFTNSNYVIAIGSGTINDLVKYASNLANIPYIIFATALSMNGYLSSNASLIKNNLKQSFSATLAKHAYFDLDILKNSPLRLIQSGLGDSICSSTVRADWLLSTEILNENYDDSYFNWNLENQLFQNTDKLINREKPQITLLTKILIFSGLAMSKHGSSMPASQGEHMVAHNYESLDPKNANLSFHGEQIAITTYFMAKHQHQILCRNEAPKIKEDSKKIFPNLNIQQANKKLESSWPELRKKILKNFKSPEQIKTILHKAKISTDPNSISWEISKLQTSMQNSHLTRKRFTFLSIR